MSSLSDRIMELSGMGYHCSQIIMQLSLDLREAENEQMIRALGALGGGMFCQDNCGTLTGGVCVLGSYCPREEGEPEPTEYQDMAKELVQYFEETNGSVNCRDLVNFDRESIMAFCPGLIERTFEKIVEILEDHGIDIYD